MAYTTRAELRALASLSDTTTFPDAMLDTAILVATETINDYCGCSFEPVNFDVTVDGTSTNEIRLRDDQLRPVLFPRSITAVTISGVAEAGPFTAWALLPEGIVKRTPGVFSSAPTVVGRNVRIQGTAGYATPPEEIKAACRIIARQYCLDQVSRTPQRTTRIQNEMGQIEFLAQPGVRRATGMPAVDAVLNRYRHRPPTIG